MEKILITGATGNIGLATLKLLGNKQFPGVEVVAAVRDVKRASQIPEIGNYQLCHFEFDEPSTYEAALKDVTKIVLIRPNQVADVSKYIFPFLSKAEKSGVKHIVFISILGAEHNRIYANHRTESFVKKMVVPTTIIRPSLFMQNLTTLHRHDIQEHDKINIPAGNGQINFIDVRDVAEAIVTVLMNPGHEHQAYDLTGPEAMDFFMIANLFSKELGREIKYSKPSTISFVRQKLLDKKHLLFVMTLSLLYNSAKSGKMNFTNDNYFKLTGQLSRNIVDFIHENRDCWLKQEKTSKPKLIRRYRSRKTQNPDKV